MVVRPFMCRETTTSVSHHGAIGRTAVPRADVELKRDRVRALARLTQLESTTRA